MTTSQALRIGHAVDLYGALCARTGIAGVRGRPARFALLAGRMVKLRMLLARLLAEAL